MIEKHELEIEAEETDLDVLLDSCGILATRPTQLLNTIVQTRKTKSLNMMHLLSLEGQQQEDNGISTKEKPPKMPLRTMKDNVVTASMTRSLDFDDLKPNRRVISGGFSGKEVKVGLPAFEEVLYQESMENSSMSSDSDVEVVAKPSETSEKSNNVKFTINVSDETSQFENKVKTIEVFPGESTAEQSQSDLQETVGTSHNAEEKRADNEYGAAVLTTTDITTESEEKQKENDEFEIIPDPKQKPSMALFHPSMKMSLR